MSTGDLPHEAHVTALASLDGIGPARMRWLLGLGTPREVWARVLVGRLPVRGGPSVDRALIDAWVAQARSIDPAERWESCVSQGIGVATLGAAGYPPALAHDLEPPVVLFHRGDPDVLGGPRVAVVGTRRATGYGLRHASQLAGDLTAAGISVVSGLALGIDAAAHGGAVGVDGAPPVAVVGAGLDAPCPRRNRALAERVVAGGLVLSEVPPGVRAAPWRFPVRNRVIAALADAVVVVESAGSGGSMHTVREALERDRTVLAVPGPVDSRASEGTNQLIVDGASVCRDAQDVLCALGEAVSTPSRRSDDAAERRPTPRGDAAALLDQLGWRPASIEQLARAAQMDFARVVAAVGLLEQDGWVASSGSWIERVARDRRVPTRPGPGA